MNTNQEPKRDGRPQESIHKSADGRAWSYRPGSYPKLDDAIEQHAAAHGTIWSPHLLGPDILSFANFLHLQELIALCPLGSDARYVLNELQGLDCFGGDRDESKRALTAHIKKSALFQRCGSYRYVQRILNSIWRNYDGLLAAKQANLKALVGTEDSILRADERRTKDAARKAAARSADPEVKSRTLAVRTKRLREQARKLHGRAEQKRMKARRWLAQADALSAKAARKGAEAVQIQRSLAEPQALQQPKDRV
jgi:hypothetical protein